jgi:hypothetical protein
MLAYTLSAARMQFHGRFSTFPNHSPFEMVLRAALVLAGAILLHAEKGAPATYVGGTLPELTADADGRIQTTDELFLEFRCRNRQIHVPWDKVNLLEYGQNVNRRVALAVVISPLFLLSKSRRHFLTVGYTDGDGKQQAMVFRVEKSKIRAVLVALEARTGLKVAYQDDEARKNGKG